MERARANSPQILSANLAALIAREDTVQARAALLPGVSSFNQFIYTQPNGTPSGAFVSNDGTHVYNNQAVVHGDIFDLGKRADYRKTQVAEAVARAKAEIAARGLVATVTENYYGMVSAMRKFANAQQSQREAEQFLDITRKQERGGVKLEVQEFYFNELLAERCRSMQTLAAASDVSLECRSPGDVQFRGDEGLLRRLLVNLLDNAIRYTPPGGKVSAELEADPAAVRIRISDTGVGIPPEATPHVFDRFYRADKSRSRQDGGFGLGLSIVKWIAEAHNGAVELTRNSEPGTTFTVTLPRDSGAAAQSRQ
jgi:signal transduction histidine kinase